MPSIGNGSNSTWIHATRRALRRRHASHSIGCVTNRRWARHRRATWITRSRLATSRTRRWRLSDRPATAGRSDDPLARRRAITVRMSACVVETFYLFICFGFSFFLWFIICICCGNIHSLAFALSSHPLVSVAAETRLWPQVVNTTIVFYWLS